jgi:5,10-methylenetetrahydrofolate reductase
MLDEVRAFAAGDVFESTPPFRLGVVSQLGSLPSWKRDADFVFVQVSFDVARLVEWRENIDFDGPVYAGVMVLASAAHAARIETAIPQIRIPAPLHERLATDPSAGVDAACELVAAIRSLDGFGGVHLVPVGRYREVAARLELDAPHA